MLNTAIKVIDIHWLVPLRTQNGGWVESRSWASLSQGAGRYDSRIGTTPSGTP